MKKTIEFVTLIGGRKIICSSRIEREKEDNRELVHKHDRLGET